MANEVQVSFSDKLTDSLVAAESALPKDFNRERFVQNCIAILNENQSLAKINPAMLRMCLLKGAYLGLDFMNKECYAIPYGNTVQFQTSYKGEIKFVKRYAIRPIKDIYAKLVRKGDEFTEEIVNGQPSISFKPLPFNDEDVIGCFAVCLYVDGGMDYEVMSAKDINDVRTSYSKQANGNAWKKSYGEMCKKTVLRRLCKHIETDFESVEAQKAWEDGSDLDTKKSPFGDVRNPDEVVDVFSGEEVIDVEATEVSEDD